MLLAADIGGTHARVALFAPGPPLTCVATHHVDTRELDSFGALLARFQGTLGSRPALTAVGVGIAGPVRDGAAVLTNGTWGTSEAEIARASGVARVRLLNDLVALAWGTLAVPPTGVARILDGIADASGPRAILAPGTGLGEARVHMVGDRPLVLGTEAGHADFAPRTDLEWRLASALRAAHGRATVEHVLSGQGFLALHAVTHTSAPCLASGADRRPADVTAAGLAGTCPACVDAVTAYVSALGAEAGNLALRELASGGVYLGGGIVPSLLPRLTSTTFTDAFLDKAPMAALVARVPVVAILDPDTALAGAALAARDAA